MAKYVDGYVVVVPKKRVKDYLKMARKARDLWREHGALDYRESVADDMRVKVGISFPKLTKLKSGEVVVFAWIVYKSRAHRDRVNAKAMKDPRLMTMCDPNHMPFDCQRMTYGGFKILVE